MAYNFTPFKGAIKEVEEKLKRDFATVRTGRSSPAVLDSVSVESYGSMMSIPQLASVTVEDAQSIRITPWDMSTAKDIEKAIQLANLGVSVSMDDKGVRVTFPSLTEERRLQIVKIAKEKLEEAKKALRAHRDSLMKDLQALEKSGGEGKDDIFRYKGEAQKLVDAGTVALEALYSKKEKEIIS